MRGSKPITYETIAFHDIAGLVRGAHSGEGLGNQFLANIRETDAIMHVVRAHDDAQVVHPEGQVDPGADLDTIETELIYADLEQAERRVQRVAREALQSGRTARTVAPPGDAPDVLELLQPLTAKPVLFVANVSEGDVL